MMLRFRAALFSRHLFKNWLSAAIKYLLIKYGLVGGYVVVKCGNVVYRLDPSLYLFIVNNYNDGNITEVHCFSTHINFNCKGIPITITLPDSMEFSYLGRSVKFIGSIPFLHDVLFENFFGGAYDDVDVGGRVIVDVGAGIGDTAVLFALRGAAKVIAIEPYPSLYGKALMNVRINGLEDRVILLNAAVSSIDGFAYAPSQEVRGYVLFRPINHESSGSVRIRTITLRTLVREYEISSGVLKMDCEGCEYEVINSVEPEILRAFEQIIIEYHNGPEPIATRLKNLGYNTTIKPIKSTKATINKQGYIIAKS